MKNLNCLFIFNFILMYKSEFVPVQSHLSFFKNVITTFKGEYIFLNLI